MSFRGHLQTYGKYKGFLIVFVLAATVTTWVLSDIAKPQFATSLSIAVNRINRQETPQYQYDGYYAIQASDLFSQTVLSWFLTPSVLVEFYNSAGVDPQIDSINQLIGRFHARKYSAQNLVVEFNEASHETAQKIAQAIATVVKDRAAALNTAEDGKPIFEVAPADPVIVETQPNALLNAIVAFVGSVLIGGVLISGFRYLQT